MNLDELFRNTFIETGNSMNPLGLLLALGASIAASFLISVMYQLFYENRATGSQIHRAFPLLGPSITTLFICIQFSLPLSLGLLGALSFVRFRTPIKEPEEIGFLMVLVASSIAIATFQFVGVTLFLIVVLLALLTVKYVPRLRGSRQKDGLLLISAPSEEYPGISEEIAKVLHAGLSDCQLESLTEVEGTTSASYSFCNLSEESVVGLEQQLQAIEKIQRVSIFFNQSGALV